MFTQYGHSSLLSTTMGRQTFTDSLAKSGCPPGPPVGPTRRLVCYQQWTAPAPISLRLPLLLVVKPRSPESMVWRNDQPNAHEPLVLPNSARLRAPCPAGGLSATNCDGTYFHGRKQRKNRHKPISMCQSMGLFVACDQINNDGLAGTCSFRETTRSAPNWPLRQTAREI